MQPQKTTRFATTQAYYIFLSYRFLIIQIWGPPLHSPNAIQISQKHSNVLPTCLFCQPEASSTVLTLKCNWETLVAHPNACVHLITSRARNPEWAASSRWCQAEAWPSIISLLSPAFSVNVSHILSFPILHSHTVSRRVLLCPSCLKQG